MKHHNGTATATPEVVELKNAETIFIKNKGLVDLLVSFDDGGTFYPIEPTAGDNSLSFKSSTPLINVVLKCGTTCVYNMLYG